MYYCRLTLSVLSENSLLICSRGSVFLLKSIKSAEDIIPPLRDAMTNSTGFVTEAIFRTPPEAFVISHRNPIESTDERIPPGINEIIALKGDEI